MKVSNIQQRNRDFEKKKKRRKKNQKSKQSTVVSVPSRLDQAEERISQTRYKAEK